MRKIILTDFYANRKREYSQTSYRLAALPTCRFASMDATYRDAYALTKLEMMKRFSLKNHQLFLH